jgi:hypothetical protein
MDAMRRGNFEAAWRLGDAGIRARPPGAECWQLSRHQQWVWDGRPLAGQRVLVRCYHGLGDTLQFARFLPLVARLAPELTVWAQPPLLPLLQRMAADFRLLPLHDGTPALDYDVDLEIMELAHALRVTLDALPGEVPYFHVPADEQDEPEPKRFEHRGAGSPWLMRSKRRVGFVAQAGEWDARRSVPSELMASLVTVPGIRAFNLRLGSPLPGAADISTADVLALAIRVSGLDLVITPDTMTAHLAGALGVPTWTLLPADADWRWMDDRADTPWYPTMRLFRQPAPGAWAPVLAQVRAELAP